MTVEDCAKAGIRDRGCKQRIPGKGWVSEWEKDNNFAITVRIAEALWRDTTTVAAMGRDEKARRRALRVKVGVPSVLFAEVLVLPDDLYGVETLFSRRGRCNP